MITILTITAAPARRNETCMIDCYWFPTPNCRRVTMMLELCELPYTRHPVDLTKAAHLVADFTRINPAGALPVIVDHDGPRGEPLTLTQSGAICLYLAAKAGRLLPTAEPVRSVALQWFMHAITDVQMLASSLFRTEACGEGSSATATAFRERISKHLRLVDERLQGREYLAGELSIADIALYPILLSATLAPLSGDLQQWQNLRAWKARLDANGAIQRGR